MAGNPGGAAPTEGPYAPAPQEPDKDGLRVSDAERDQAIGHLGERFAEGRLRHYTLVHRVEAARKALDRRELMFPSSARRRFTIGRDAACDLVLPTLSVSRWHAGLKRCASGWLLDDLGSTNGTRLNGWRVTEPVPVRPRGRVSFGALTFVLAAPGTIPAPTNGW